MSFLFQVHSKVYMAVERSVHESAGFHSTNTGWPIAARGVGYGRRAYLSVIVADDAVIADKLRRTLNPGST